MMRLIASCALLALVLGSAPAVAQRPRGKAPQAVAQHPRGKAPRAAATAAPSPGKLLYQKTTKYIFKDDEVPVELARPDSLVVSARLFGTFDSLVKPRASFIPELIKSCEDL